MKRFFVFSTIFVSILIFLGSAQAIEQVDINIYGASAQHLFWNDAADNFLTDVLQCSNTEHATKDSSNGITRGDNCSLGGVTYNHVYIRYSSKASYDGIKAMCGVASADCQDGFSRKMVDATSCPGGKTGDWNDGTCASLACTDITLGASDVAGESFVQASGGCLKGPVGQCVYEQRSFNGIPTCGNTGSKRTLLPYRPLVVPFGFFVNNSVTVTKCLSPSPIFPDANHKAISSFGNTCYDPDADGHSADCMGYYKCVGGFCNGGVNKNGACTKPMDCPDVAVSGTNCATVPLDNISRLMAVSIFTGQNFYWSDFGCFFPAIPIHACLRHAGSGTHATLDASVLRGDASLPTADSIYSEPYIWFNDGSSDMMNCINNLNGAIGYADADQLAGTKNYPKVHAIKYQGIEPSRVTIRNGLYDFWSAQWIYEDPEEPDYANTHPIVTAIMNYAATPANMPATKAAYWATQAEMTYMKDNDFQYPSHVGFPTTCP